jgi:hypothetical protein
MASSASFSASFRPAMAIAAAALALALVSPACSSKSTAGCVDSNCAEGNKCLELDGEVRCRKVCSSNHDPSTSCPFNHTCVPRDGAESFCVKNALELTEGPGLWGTPCVASQGIDNPACDADQGFFCYGTAPNDGAAYCTLYGCGSDSECAAGYYCGDVNSSPNVASPVRIVGATEKVCLKRTYCAPCRGDMDCPAQGGVEQRCVADDDGNQFCATTCANNGNCPYDARCVEGPAEDAMVCYPRAGRCVGDGSVCSPCRSDADCPEGACVQGKYTTEKHCTVASKITCTVGTGGVQPGVHYDCPTLTEPTELVRCIGSGDKISKDQGLESVPPNHCHGLYRLDKSIDVGCWTPDR